MPSIAAVCCPFAAALLCAAAASLAAVPAIVLTPAQRATAGIESIALDADTGIGGRVTLAGRVEQAQQGAIVLRAPIDAHVAGVYAVPGTRVERGARLLALAGPELLEMRRELAVAGAEVDVARQRRERDDALVREGIAARSRVEQSDAALAAAEATLAAHRAALVGGTFAADGRLVVTAPAAGELGGPPLRVGATVARGDLLATIGAPAGLRLSLGAPAATARRLRTGDGLLARTPDCEAAGRVEGVGTQVDAASGIVTVLASVHATRCLTPGETVTATVTPASAATGGYALPASAFVQRGAVTFVFVDTEGGFVPVAVDAGAARDGFARAPSLGAGTRVVVRGAVLLKGAWLAQASE